MCEVMQEHCSSRSNRVSPPYFSPIGYRGGGSAYLSALRLSLYDEYSDAIVRAQLCTGDWLEYLFEAL
jgi:hypothetical protein